MVDTLGHGGMGVVYLVFQRRLRRYVALKLLAPHWTQDTRARARFIREARAAARLSHPGIVPIIDIGEVGDSIWYTMEYMEGGDLSQLLAQRGGRLPWREAAALVQTVASAVQSAHDAGVAHRDLKPSNILLDAAGAPRIADFGLAWLAGLDRDELTMAGEIIGTPAYLAPESITRTAHDVNARPADVYSLGALLFHLVAGRPPFVGEHVMGLITTILKERPPRLRAVGGAGIPVELEIVCDRCLEKRPLSRYPSAAALALALADCLAPPSRRFGQVRIRPWVIAVAGSLGVIGWLGLLVLDRWALARPEAATTAAVRLPTAKVAVLPFAIDAAGGSTALLVAGLQDELVSTLTRISDLRVIGRHSVAATADRPTDLLATGRRLGADAVLCGTVQKEGEMLRIRVQLIETKDGTTQWSQGYTRRETILFNLETEIATEVALQLKAHLQPGSSARRTGLSSSEPAAQERFVRARRLVADGSASEAQLIEAARLLEEAAQLDPTFARALAELSLVHTQLYSWGDDRTEVRLEKGLRAAQDALRLNPDLAAAPLALGLCYFRGTRDYVTARPLIERAQRLDPNNPDVLAALAHLERRQGDFGRAARWFVEALSLDPLNAILAYNTADTYLRLRQYETAARILDQALGLLPGHVALVKLKGDLHLAWKGDLGPMENDIRHRNPALPKPLLYLMDKVDWLILANRLDDALAVLRASDFTVIEGQSVYYTKPGYEALVLAMANRQTEAATAAVIARQRMARDLAQRPNDARLLLHAGQMEAIAGNAAEGERLVRRTLTPGDPACVDAFDRGLYLRGLAVLLAETGQEAKVREVLATLLQEPNQTSLAYLSRHPVLRRYVPDRDG